MAADPTAEEEVRRLERHYAVNPDGLVFGRLADAHRRCGRLERSLELLRRGLDRHPDYPTAHLVHGRTLRDAGRTQDAEEAFRRALELDPENPAALRSLAEIAVERGEIGRARRWADRLRRVDPSPSPRPREDAARPEGPAGADSEHGGEAGDRASRTDDGAGRDAAEDGGGAESDDLAGGERLSDGNPGGKLPREEGLESEIAAMSDEQWWSGSDEADDADAPDVATETMARLYEEQGLYEQAAQVYGRLLQRRRDDAELRRRLEAARRRARGEPPEGTGAGRTPEGQGSVPAREHFRALLRGRASAPDGGRERADGDRPGSPGGNREAAGETAG